MITGHFLDADLPVVDGVVRMARAYRARMQQRLGPSWIVGPRHPDGAPEDDTTLRYPSIPFRKPYRIGLPGLEPGLRRRLHAVGFDLVHSHSPLMAGELALPAARRRSAPCVFTMHTRLDTWAHHQYRTNPGWLGILAADALHRGVPGPARLPVRPRDLVEVTDRGLALCAEQPRRMIWRYIRRVDCVFVASHALARDVRAYADVCLPGERAAPDTEIVVAPCGIDFPETAPRQLDVRRRLQLGRDTQLLLYVGQLVYEKRVDFLLVAMRHLVRAGRDVHLVLVGDGPVRADFEALARDLGIADRCTFTGLVQDRGVLADHYDQADLFVFPSTFETQGLVAMEAASFGLPTVGQRGAPGLTDHFTDGVDGDFSTDAPEAYAQVVGALLDNPDRRGHLGEQARRVVVRMDGAIDAVIATYRALRARRGPVAEA